MADITIGAKVSIVNIIPVMTIYAVTGKFLIFIKRLKVAAIAMQSIMCPLDLEIGLIMIKLPDEPVVRVMALLAVIA